ncbi:hypothetical protein ACIHBQ_31550 [Streptomyces sp. NPDC052492]
MIVDAGATLAVENPAAEAAWVTTSQGLGATPTDGTRVAPPWAN